MRKRPKLSSRPQGSRSEIGPVAMCPGPKHESSGSSHPGSVPRSFVVRRCLATRPCHPPPRRDGLPTPRPQPGSGAVGRPRRIITRGVMTASVPCTLWFGGIPGCWSSPHTVRRTPNRDRHIPSPANGKRPSQRRAAIIAARHRPAPLLGDQEGLISLKAGRPAMSLVGQEGTAEPRTRQRVRGFAVPTSPFFRFPSWRCGFARHRPAPR